MTFRINLNQTTTMKTKSIAAISLSFLLPVITSIAQPQAAPPAPPAPPAPAAPVAPHSGPGHHDRDKGPKVPIIFLGVESSPVPSVVCEQMNLPKGFGLVVDYVVPDSPAAAAGVQQNDILKMLNDQILMEPNQLRKLLQSFTDGTTVTLTIIRKGQEQKLTVKLTKKEVAKRHAFNLMNGGFDDFDFNFDDIGNVDVGDVHVDMGDLKQRLQDMKEQMKERMAEQKEQLKDRLAQQKDVIREAVERAHEAAERAREQAQRTSDQHVQVHTSSNGLQTTRIDVNKAQIVFSDDKGELRIENVGGKKILTAKDPKGLLLFSGPVETPQDIEKLPGEVKQRFETLQKNDLPSAFASQHDWMMDDQDSDHDVNVNPDDENDDEDSDSDSTEQVSITPQVFPRSLLPIRTILI